MMTILWILIYVGLFYFMFRYGCGGHGGHRRHSSQDSEKNRSHEGHRSITMSTSTDPVCGMTVSEEDGYERRYNGRAYRFCSKECLDQFEQNPERYRAEDRVAS